ncbi:MAG: VCBS repeat-containing protein [Verrucomicrobiae bacterium]|nr:VCBS repeat-containing protein [Verrucomicrobiae bacterium]
MPTPQSHRGSWMLSRRRRQAWAAVAWLGSLTAAPLFSPGPLPLRETPLTPAERTEAAQLARTHCSACHLFPEPALLERRTWHGGTEPLMRRLLGLDTLDPELSGDRERLETWRRIWDWYFAEAPGTFPGPPPPRIPLTLSRFDPVFLPYRPQHQMVSLLRVDSGRRQLLVGNAMTRTLDLLDASGTLLSSLLVESPPVDIHERPDGWYVPLIWDLAPHTTRRGRLLRVQRDGDTWIRAESALSGLPRPTSVAFGDLDDDGIADWVVSGFGHVDGLVAWWSRGNPTAAPYELLARPGATRVEVADLNHDGRTDVVVQTAQAQEGLYWFENRGASMFAMHAIAEFPPVWGGSGFRLVDWDADGDLDLLVTNGDSGEYLSSPRPYHGIRLYRNLGTRETGAAPRFEEAWFYPLAGAYDVRAADLDGDGDLDIVAIAYFPDFDGRREGSFVVLWNEGGLNFRPESLDAGMSGRWLVMDVGDVDGDGHADIVLGAANRGAFDAPTALRAAWAERGPSLLLLRNRGR